LDDDEEAALADATTEDLMTLAEIVGTNPQVLNENATVNQHSDDVN